jgi:hypothetical protein
VGGIGAVPAGASAVVLNLTATRATQASVITAYPAGHARPNASNLNVRPGVSVANLITVPLGAHGAISLHSSAGALDLVADVVGYYRTGSGARFNAVTPCRIYDTRVGVGTCLPGWGRDRGGALLPNHYLPLAVPGLIGPVPLGATALALNITAVNARATVLSAFPDSVTVLPLSSTLNVAGPSPVANQALVALPPGVPNQADKHNPAGKVDIYNFFGRTDVIVDLSGYFR